MQCEPNHHLIKRCEFGAVGVLFYQSKEGNPPTGIRRCPDDTFGKYFVGIGVVIQREWNAKIVLRQVEIITELISPNSNQVAIRWALGTN